MKYKIADIILSMDPDAKTKERGRKYEYYGDLDVQMVIDTPTYEMYSSQNRECSFNEYEHSVRGLYFYRQLIDFDGLMLHASAIVVDGKAYLFSAPSGTGKSTHTGKWLEMLGNKAFILNDDKPAIRILDDDIYAYGTPWSGKYDISENVVAKLQGICFLTRDNENWIRRMPPMQAFSRLFHASLRNLTKEQSEKECQLITKMISRISIYEMGCTPTIDAAKMAYEVMSKL